MKKVENHPLIGRKYKDVRDTHNFRIVRQDQTSYGLTMDYNPTRVNVEIDNGIITKVYFG